MIAQSFNVFVKEEISYRKLLIGSADALNDIIETAKIIAVRDKNTEEPFKSIFAELQKGIRNFAPFLIPENFRLDDAIAAGVKAAYLGAKILTGNHSIGSLFGQHRIKSGKAL